MWQTRTEMGSRLVEMNSVGSESLYQTLDRISFLHILIQVIPCVAK